ncbi:MAG: glycosyltransferase [Clostridia bacterium]|nr:glycosyltransferase [Clostridia bacterium]
MKKKILLYGDLTLNIVDGSSVWLASLAKLLSQDKDNVVDVLLKEKVTNDVLTGELSLKENISFLESNEFLPKSSPVSPDNIVNVMTKIDELRDYSCIIVRGFEAVKAIVKDKHLSSKLIPYITNFCHDKNAITQKEKDELLTVYNSTNQFFVQTVQMREYLKDVLSVDGEKFRLLNPMIFKDNGTAPAKLKKSIVYAGKIAKEWNILELLDIMDRLYQVDREITLHFVGDKFNRDLAGKKQEILGKLKNSPNIVFYGSLPKSETTKIVNSCELGYSFRSTAIDNDESLELSSKVLEYCFCNVPLILRKTKMHSEVLGEDYPLYVESVEDCVNAILDYFGNTEKYSNFAEVLAAKVEKFSPESIYKNVRKALEHFPSKKMRLLISGHDLKFIKALFPYFEKHFELTVQKYPEYTHLNISESKKLLKKTDIVWCEWLLLNAEWYSANILSFQKLFIRAHKFEIAKNYGNKVKWQNVDKLITVSYYWMEQFADKFDVDRAKITCINNFIDVAGYPTEKSEDAKYNIAMIGILPKLKGFAKAVEILKVLKENDSRYKLYVAGKRPEQFPGTWNVPEQKAYYLETFKKIKDYGLEDSVIYVGWKNTQEFLGDMGYTLSLSDSAFPESFHVAPLECMASAGVGLAVYWDGIEYIYPPYTVFNSPEEIAQKIIELNGNDTQYRELAEKSRKFVSENYDLPIIRDAICNTVN